METKKTTIKIYDKMITEAKGKEVAVKNTLISVLDDFLKNHKLTDNQKGQLARLRARIITELDEF